MQKLMRSSRNLDSIAKVDLTRNRKSRAFLFLGLLFFVIALVILVLSAYTLSEGEPNTGDFVRAGGFLWLGFWVSVFFGILMFIVRDRHQN